MKDLIKKRIRESLLTERLMDIDEDVEMLYNTYFKEDIEEVRATGRVTRHQFTHHKLDTSDLITPLSEKAHKLNPCEIHVNRGSNFYKPTSDLISISINSQAVNFILDDFDGSLKKAHAYLESKIPDQAKNFINEFNPSRVKGSIHHELVHWIDDTLHNKHITNRAITSRETGTMKKGDLPINADKMEIQGQIHNIYQLKKEFKEIWDDITFNDLIKLSTTLSVVDRQLKDDINKQWRKDLITRMHREGLLGKNMVKVK